MSGLTLRDIVDRASKSGQTVTEGLIHFLDEKLLGSDEPVTVSEVGGVLLRRLILQKNSVAVQFAHEVQMQQAYLYILTSVEQLT